MQINWDVTIAMDDGVELRADVFRPDAPGRYPVILSHGVYAKGIAFQEAYRPHWERLLSEHPDVAVGSSNRYQAWEVVDPERFVPHGYVCVRVDSRGAGRSPGYASPFSPREISDFEACIEWAGTRDWSSGKVGLAGISYYAISQWLVACRQPQHLAAMIPWEGSADFYRDGNFHGGIRSVFWENWYRLRFLPVQHGVGERGAVSRHTGELASGPPTHDDDALAMARTDLPADIAAHPFDDEYHQQRSADWSRVTVPFLSAGNWGGQGLHLRGNTEAFVRADSTQKWLEIHGLEHWTHFYTAYGRALQLRFFDHFLKGEDNGWEEEPPVRLQVRHVDKFVERTENEWPIARTVWTRLYLDATGGLQRQVSSSGAQTSFDSGGDSVTYTSGPFEADTEITGPLAATLFVSSSTADADVFVTVRLFAPDGEEVVFQGAVDPHTPISQGWLRASHRELDPELSKPYRPYHKHQEQEFLEPGEVYELCIEIWPTSIVIPAGYRLALTVGGTDYEFAAGTGTRLPNFANELRGSGPFLHTKRGGHPPSLYCGRTTVHSGPAHPSMLIVPVIPPKEGARETA